MKSKTDNSATLNRNMIADTVHQAVCQISVSDEFCPCIHYTMAGLALIANLTGKVYLPQIGSLHVEYGLESNAGIGGLASTEFHAWLVGPIKRGQSSGRAIIPSDKEVIDFYPRHFKSWLEAHPPADMDRNPCVTTDTPQYIWSQHCDLPKWYCVNVSEKATTRLKERIDVFKPLMIGVQALWNLKSRP